jgi:hypothetical protein
MISATTDQRTLPMQREPSSKQVLGYYRDLRPEKPASWFGLLSCGLGLAGLLACIFPFILDQAGGWALAWFITGAGIGVVGLCRGERPLLWPVFGVSVHLASVFIWWAAGGWAYFGAGP